MWLGLVTGLWPLCPAQPGCDLAPPGAGFHPAQPGLAHGIVTPSSRAPFPAAWGEQVVVPDTGPTPRRYLPQGTSVCPAKPRAWPHACCA